MPGSSPLTRGKPRGGGLEVGDDRLIPAHAGKTRRDAGLASSSWAHPRSRGENKEAACDVVRAVGSSPLTRGKPEAPDLQRVGGRLIPAHAGKTEFPISSFSSDPAHPRSRGENHLAAREVPRDIGSSPLTRGKRIPGGPQLRADRLIPAHAGKTGPTAHELRGRRAHPRSRGENGPTAPLGVLRAGSSPLTRGKLPRQTLVISHIRLIPAHAGKTLRYPVVTLIMRAHPRSRGENASLEAHSSEPTGSSPLTRGKRFYVPWGRGRARLIPAHAGKTPSDGLRRQGLPAHPRSRGENTS